MKKLLLFAIALFATIANYAQELNYRPDIEKYRVSQEEMDRLPSLLGTTLSRELQSLFIDYGFMDSYTNIAAPDDIRGFVWPFNSRYNQNDSTGFRFNYIGMRINELEGYTTPGDEIETSTLSTGAIEYPNYLPITIDSVFVFITHENNSGQPDTFIVEIRDQAANGNLFPNGTLRWADTLITASTFEVTTETIFVEVIDEILFDTVYVTDELITSDTIFVDESMTEIDTILFDTTIVYLDTNFVATDTTFTIEEQIISDTTFTGESLSPGGNWIGQNSGRLLSFPVDYTTNGERKVGFTFQYLASKADTLGFRATFMPNPDNPDLALQTVYPNSFLRWPRQFGNDILNTSNIFYPPAEVGQDTGRFEAQNWDVIVAVSFDLTGIDESVKMPLGMAQNFPNPTSNSTVINYKIKRTLNLNLSVYNSNGELVAIEDLGNKSQGEYSFDLNTEAYKSGLYYYQISGDGYQSDLKKMLIVH